MSKKELQHLLRKYLRGECTPHEIEMIEKWSSRIADPELELDQAEKNRIQSKIYRNVQHSMKGRERPINWWWSAAAAVALLIVFVGYSFFFEKLGGAIVDQQATNEVDVVVYENLLAEVQNIQLPDGSTVVLQPDSRIRHRKNFGGQKREVWLTGEAFFEVTKDVERPFFVYGSNVVTQVLGTSFLVKAPADTKTIEVEVKTGRVSVFENKEKKQNENSLEQKQAPNGVVLTPNQKVVYYIQEDLWVTSLVEIPEPVNPSQLRPSLVFENTPLQEIIKSMEQDYHIEFVLDSNDVFSCTFTGDISAMALYDALDVITKSIGATYEIRGTKILINGKGCD